MGIIVEFVGLPGVGKTTLSQSVVAELKSQGIDASEPTHKIENRSGFYRVASKARFAATALLLDPRSGFNMIQAILSTDQESVSDYVRVLFNLLYINGIMVSSKPNAKPCLLDQGLYQGLWSVGYRSSHEWNDLLEQFGEEPPQVIPDLVVFVEAEEATIADRLRERSKDDTRFTPGSEAFERGLNGYEHLKSHVQSVENGPRSVVIKNETRDSLKPNANRIVDELQSLDRGL